MTVSFPAEDPEEPEEKPMTGEADLDDIDFITDPQPNTEDYIQIWDVEDLSLVGSGQWHDDKEFKDDAYYIQMTDIDLEGIDWEPLRGQEGPSLSGGTYDGNGYSILNLKVDTDGLYGGLFRYIMDSTVKNLTFIDPEVRISNSQAGTGTAGVLVGVMVGNCFVDQVRVIGGRIVAEANPSGGGIRNVGGIAGQFVGEGESVMQRCYVENMTIENMTIESSSAKAGGLVGYLQYSEFKDSYAKNVTIAAPGGGGLLGQANGCEISNVCCENGQIGIAGESDNAGGLMGAIFDSSLNYAHFVGDVFGLRHVGGLIGYVGDHLSSIAYCYADANIYSEGESPLAERVGGIVGAASNAMILSTHFRGNIEAECNYVGGLLGRAGRVTIGDCSFSGSIQGNSCVGGLAGELSDNSILTSCNSKGSVSGYNNVAGVVGGFWNSEVSYTSSSMQVSADAEHGFAAGIAVGSGGTVNNVSFFGEILSGYWR